MASPIKSTFTTICLLAIISLFISENVQADGGFIYSCTNIGQIGQAIAATCNDDNGNGQFTTLDLNQCVVNANGALYCQSGGGFGASCSNIVIESQYLYATCTDDNGNQDPTNLDLNQCLGNHNGVLNCL